MISLLLTILASFYSDILTVPTAVFNEVSVSYNLGATLGFWILLAPLYWNLFPEELKIYMALIHSVPLISHFINAGITYEIFQINDWKLTLAFGAVYAYYNLIGTLD